MVLSAGFHSRLGPGSIFTSFVLCSLLAIFAALGVFAVLPDRLLRGAAVWRAEIMGGLWALCGVLAIVGSACKLEGELSWFPVFGLDGPALPMLVLLAFAGGVAGSGAAALACVFVGMGFLALSPLVFGLLTGTALVLLAAGGWRSVCLPFAVLPACIPADSPFCVPLLCLTVLLMGWAVSVQKGPTAVLPGMVGLFLLGRLLAEVGELSVLPQVMLVASGCLVAATGTLQAMRDKGLARIASGLCAAWYGILVVAVALALVSSFGGMETFRMAIILGMGAPMLALIGLLWLAQWQQAEPKRRIASLSGHVLVAGLLMLFSIMPPFGGFAVLWSLLVGAYDAIAVAQPVGALTIMLLLALLGSIMVLMGAGLLRAGAALLFPSTVFQPNQAPVAAEFVWPSWICAGAAMLLVLLPGLWLSLADHLVVGPVVPPLKWSRIATIWLEGGGASFTPVFTFLALGAALAAAAMLVRLLGFLPFGRVIKPVPVWRQGAPIIQPAEGRTVSYEGAAPLWPACMALFGLVAETRKDKRLARRSRVALRYGRRWLFRGAEWCETQGLVLILLLLGGGLLVGLFVGK
ncbi:MULTISPECIES: hypothetical protein [Acetobacter]|uniref:Uncharacterized protein n=2 Tax=Acetobacter TaxID=434 RepID=A0AAN1PIG6_9PROT|nr:MULTISPECIES: hypothetical protein [Acetobacter]ASL39732.1 hypothetical protein CBI36_04250 [Acetobacter oryzifermentans]AXN00840.1 hypothetical protein CJF59_09965 [Acetobacter pomorum]KAA8395790.1 hypothetical protein FKW22_07600 [Acetobacter sp. DmW_125124]KAA8396622.1 hypothetical protein FKW19_08000 [Acetobacter sp. DmW_125128]KAA8398220.1 hypothetical protein FKW20_07635 [Acetobacter sp. DmW_125127]